MLAVPCTADFLVIYVLTQVALLQATRHFKQTVRHPDDDAGEVGRNHSKSATQQLSIQSAFIKLSKYYI